MKVLLTGAGGTLGPHVLQSLNAHGHSVIAFDRHACSPDDASAVAQYLKQTAPAAVVHLGFGAEAFAAQLAASCAAYQTPFVFTSTAMVFHHQPAGPHHPHNRRNAQDDYGRYKIRCEDAVLAANPQACIARLGWQIHADAQGQAAGNNMLAALDAEFAKTGQVRASTAWVPACSFMPDTAQALVNLLASNASGIHHIDANAECAWTFARIVQALSDQYRRHWRITLHDEYQHDQRLVPSVSVAAISERLGG
jgi:dTDP-4-dehydrorhamnose reductase